jgi:hypothetical protein
MWERAVRDYIGLEGTITALRGFRMKKFNPVGTTTVVQGEVIGTGPQPGQVELRVWCENSGDVTVGPGTVAVTVPLASS